MLLHLSKILFLGFKLYVAFDFSGTKATRAYVFSCRSPIFNDPDTLYVWSPNSFGCSVRVADFVAGHNAF